MIKESGISEMSIDFYLDTLSVAVCPLIKKLSNDMVAFLSLLREKALRNIRKWSDVSLVEDDSRNSIINRLTDPNKTIISDDDSFGSGMVI